MKKIFKTQSGRFVAGLIAFLLVIGVTWGVGKLPFAKVDVTAQHLMSMSAQSKEIVRAVEKDVTIYQLATESTKDQWTSELISKYVRENGHISYELLDPTGTKAQKMVASLGGITADMLEVLLEENSLIVSSGSRSVLLSPSDIYQVVYNQQALAYGQYVLESQKYAADDKLANAILYVTRDDLPVMYMLSGHGETPAGSMLLSLLREKNIAVETLSLGENAVPENAAALLIEGMTSDLTDAETDAILSYLKQGGKLILLTDYQLNGMKNLETVMAYYGMEPVNNGSVVLDASTGYNYGADYPMYLKPDLTKHEITTELTTAGAKAVLGLPGALERNSIRRTGLNVVELMETSDGSYMKNMQTTTLEQEETDEIGPFTVAMAAGEGDTRVVWYASATLFGDNEIAISNGVNLYLLRGTIDWMVEGVEQADIPQQELSSMPVSIPANMTMIMYAAVFAPALVLLVVGLVSGKRKKA